jgi:transcriptional regulator with XRE-family HTH domain
MKNIVKKNFRPDLKAIGRRIRQIRGFDLTQAQFGKLVGIGQTQLSKYEKGQSAPTLEFLLKLKAQSGKSLDWIVSGEEVSRPTV